MARKSEITRTTKETNIAVELDLDGTGNTSICTQVPFFDHMLDAFGRHGLLDLTVRCEGDVEVDAHHTVEDCGIVLGKALNQAIGQKKGIVRYGSSLLPMDETLVMAALDFSGRGGCYWDVPVPAQRVGSFDTELAQEFFIAFAANAGVTLHVRTVTGENSHHIIEASFKALARALRQAVESDPRVSGIPSTKGSL